MDEGRERVTEPRVDVAGGPALSRSSMSWLATCTMGGRACCALRVVSHPWMERRRTVCSGGSTVTNPTGESALGVRMPNCARLKRLSLNTVRTSHWRATAMAAVPFGNSTSRVGCPRKRSIYSGGSDVPGLGSRGNRIVSLRFLSVPVENTNGAGTAVDFYIVAVGYCGRRIGNCHYGWNPKHAAGYRGVGEHAATLGDQSRGVEHQW